MSTPTARHLEAHWNYLTSTPLARRTLARWAADPSLTPACESWLALLEAIRDEGFVANRILRQAQAGDELAHLTMIVALLPRLSILVYRRRGLWTASRDDMVAEAISTASIELTRPALADTTDRVLFRIASNVDWILFRQPARRRRNGQVHCHNEAGLEDLAGAPGFVQRAAPPGLHPSEHVTVLLEVAEVEGLDPHDAELVRRRILLGDRSTPEGMNPRTHRDHTQLAVARFAAWVHRAAALDSPLGAHGPARLTDA